MYKDILVHVDGSLKSSARLELALRVAAKFGARLTALYVVTRQQYSSRLQCEDAAAVAAKTDFDRKVALAAVRAEWRMIESSVVGTNPVEIVNSVARSKDLVIVGQAEKTAQPSGIPGDFPEMTLLGAGRPVLVVPYAGTFPTVGERVLVAWNNGRESTRALQDAMPFLGSARQVKVLEVERAGLTARPLRSSGFDICDHLQCHGIEARSEQVVVAGAVVGDLLLNQAWEGGFDLLVMGVFNRSLRGAIEVGTVARHILDHMTLPVLLGH